VAVIGSREEPCCRCGAVTAAGIFIRRDPHSPGLVCSGSERHRRDALTPAERRERDASDAERRAMTPRELLAASAQLATTVLEYVKGPFAQRDPENANYWRSNVETAFGDVIKAHRAGYDPKPGSERMWIHAMDKLLCWCWPAVEALGQDAPAARAQLETFIEMVLREGRRHGMRLMIQGRYAH
jgi:hypothetical protein